MYTRDFNTENRFPTRVYISPPACIDPTEHNVSTRHAILSLILDRLGPVRVDSELTMPHAGQLVARRKESTVISQTRQTIGGAAQRYRLGGLMMCQCWKAAISATDVCRVINVIFRRR